VRGSWAEIFGSGQRLKVHISNQVVLSGMMLAIHSVHENILVQGESRSRAPITAQRLPAYRQRLENDPAITGPRSGETRVPPSRRRKSCIEAEHLLPSAVVATGRAPANPVRVLFAIRRSRGSGSAGTLRTATSSTSTACPAPRAPPVVLFHGLEGSSASHYAGALARELEHRGWRGAVVPLSRLLGEPNRLPRAYHSGDAEEIGWILRLRGRVPRRRPLFAAACRSVETLCSNGFGEDAESKHVLLAAAAVSAPVDLMAAGMPSARGFNSCIRARSWQR